MSSKPEEPKEERDSLLDHVQMTARLRFPKRNRVTQDRDFKKILFEGEKYRGQFLNLYILKADQRAFGISISKRIKGAVLRNRLKRVFKEYYRLHQDLFEKGLRILVVIQKVPEKISMEHAGEMIRELIRSKNAKKNRK